jgi:hypothetical protein
MKKMIAVIFFCLFVFYGCKGRDSLELGGSIKCDTGKDGCSVISHNGSCFALYFNKTGKCFTESSSDKIVPYPEPLDIDDRINLSAKNVPLSKIALFFDSIKGNKISVPPEKENMPVNISVKKKTIRETLESLELSVFKEGLKNK